MRLLPEAAVRLNRGVLTTSAFRLSHVWTSGSPAREFHRKPNSEGDFAGKRLCHSVSRRWRTAKPCSCGRQPVLHPATVRCGDGRLILCCPLRVERSSAKNSRLRAERCRPVTGQKV